MRNLQEIIPAFFTGPGGARLTPEQIAARQEVAKSLLAKATDTSPNAGGWASILSKGVMGLSAGIQEGRAERAAQANADANSETSRALLGSLLRPSTPSTGGGWTGMAPTADVTPSPSVASALMQSPQMVENQPPVPGLQAVQMPSILPQSFLAAVDRTEGAAGYDTLFGHAQKGAFKGTDISRMPIRDVIAFTDPSGPYAQSVKAQVGRVATPVGRYQVVGTTLRNAVGALGLDPNQPFDAATQDRVAAYLATNRIRSARDLPSQISALRSEWEGFKNVPDDQMAQIIADLQNVDPMAAQPGAAASANIPMGGAAQEVAAPAYVDPMVVNPNSRVAPTPSVEVAQALAPQPNTGYFPPAPQAGGLDPAVIQALSDPTVSPQNKQIAMSLVDQYQARQQAAQEQAEAQALRQQEIQQRQQFLAANNLDPNIAFVDEAFAEAAKSPFRQRNTAVVNGVLVDAETGAPIYEGQPEPTTGMRDYQAYAQFEQQQGRTPLGPLEYEQALRKSGASQVNNILGGGKFAEESDKLAAGRMDALVNEGRQATSLMGDLQSLAELGTQIRTGKGAEAMAALGPYMQALGIDVSEDLEPLQAYQSIVDRLAPQMRIPGTGASSDFDAKQFLSSLPSVGRLPGGNEIINSTMQAVQQTKIEAANIARQALRGDIGWQEAEDMIAKLPNPYQQFKAWQKEGRTAAPSGVRQGGENPLPPQETGQRKRLKFTADGELVE